MTSTEIITTGIAIGSFLIMIGDRLLSRAFKAGQTNTILTDINRRLDSINSNCAVEGGKIETLRNDETKHYTEICGKVALVDEKAERAHQRIDNLELQINNK